MLLALDMRLELGHNNDRQGYHPWEHREDLTAPMSGVAFMQRAITLLIVETKQMHRWPGATGGVATTSSPGGDIRAPVCLYPWVPDATH
jgi:hypothetical protein